MVYNSFVLIILLKSEADPAAAIAGGVLGALVLVGVIAAMFGVGMAVFLRGRNKESGYYTRNAYLATYIVLHTLT